MIYRSLHLLLRFWLRIHFRRIFISNETEIPANGPVLLACNHPNSFLDAVVIALLFKRPVNFLARSDVFKKPIAKWILTKLHLIPIYRLQEGVENIEKNKDTFRICSEILAKGEVLLIFSEGNCELEKRLRPLKKGSARIVFGAEELADWKLNIRIIPVGINYTNPTQFRTELLISFGVGFSSGSWKDSWLSDHSRTIINFNEQLKVELLQNLLIIPKKEFDPEAEALLQLCRALFKYPLLKFIFKNDNRLKIEQKLLKSYFAKESTAQINRYSAFNNSSAQAGLSLKAAIPKIHKYSTALLLIGFIPAIIGFILHALPLAATILITKKSVKDPKFKSSVIFGIGAIITYLWYLFLGLLLFALNGWLVLLLIIPPYLNLICLIWWELIQQRRNRLQFIIFKRKSPKVFAHWKHERNELMMQIHGSID